MSWACARLKKVSELLRTLVIIAPCATLLAACAAVELDDPNTLVVYFACNPAGATLYENDKSFGTCPRNVSYKISNEDRARGEMTLRGVKAIWISGASSSVDSINAKLQKGLRQTFSFERPRSANYDVDANYALNLERNQALRDQTRATILQAEALRDQSVTVRVDSPPQRSTNCVSRRLYDTVYTDCN